MEHYMKRRNFLKYLTMLGLGPLMSRFLLSCAEPPILGVRSICLMHYTINEIGNIATENPKHNGLTHFGKRVVEKMPEMGMVVGVAHAHSLTLKDIAAINSRPIMDSHTSPAPVGNPSESTEKAIRRMRSWKEMEWVAKTGGVIGTWPLRYTQDPYVLF